MSRKVAIVTGGAGFIGSHMVDLLLEQGFVVRAIDNLVGGREKNIEQHANDSRFSFEQMDINALDCKNPVFKGGEYIFHFAGIGDIVPSIESPTAYLETNVMGTVKVLEAARFWGDVKRFVYAASSSCYGMAVTPTREYHKVAPMHPYALSKYQGESVAFHWHTVYGLPVNSIRIFNAYGTRVRTTGAYGAVFGVFLKQKLARKPYTVVGNGLQRRDFVYVTDVVRAFLAAAESMQVGEIWNVGGGNPQSVNTLIKLLGVDHDVVYLPKRPGEPDCTWASIRKITRELGWMSQISFPEGIRKMLMEIEHWRDAPLWDEDSIADATQTWFHYLQEA